MKRAFLSKRNALLSPAGVSAGAAALLFVLFFAVVHFFAPNFFLTIFTPAFRAGNAATASVHGVLSSFEDTAALAKENERLTAQNTALMLENRTLVDTQKTFSALLAGASRTTGVIAGVIARPPETAYDTLILAGGLEDGISNGMEVFAEGGVPAGVITNVDATHARATLFSSHGRTAYGWVGQDHVPLTLVGAGGGAFTAILPRSVSVEVGATVYLPGPGALPVGTVARIDADPASPEQALRIVPAVNLFSITWVTVRESGAAFRSSLVASSTPL